MIIVGFSRSRSVFHLGSRIIQEVEKRPYSHVFIGYSCPVTHVELIAQASHGCVNLWSLDLFGVQNEIIRMYSIPCDAIKFRDVLKFINENLGRPYSFLQIVAIAFKKLFHVELPYENKDEAFICSEFAKRILDIAGFTEHSKDDYITPSDLEELMRNLKSKEI